jgi:hypothetical protein
MARRERARKGLCLSRHRSWEAAGLLELLEGLEAGWVSKGRRRGIYMLLRHIKLVAARRSALAVCLRGVMLAGAYASPLSASVGWMLKARRVGERQAKVPMASATPIADASATPNPKVTGRWL